MFENTETKLKRAVCLRYNFVRYTKAYITDMRMT